MNTSFLSGFTVFAHRGASGHEPENTLRSFTKALELGARWIELDVRLVEGVPVVFHDRILKRITGRSGVVEKQSLDLIRSLDAGRGEKIPLLSEVLALAQGKASLQVELKSANAAAATANLIAEALAHGAVPESFLISSFERGETATFKRILPEVPTGLLIHGYPRNVVEQAQEISAVSVHINLDAVTPYRVQEIHDAGLKVFVYTVNDLLDLAHVKSLGVDGVFTDFPDRIR